MTNSSKTSSSPVEDGPQYGDMYDMTWTSSSSNDDQDKDFDLFTLLVIFSPIIYIIGLVGNGIVICLLGFHIKRSPFTTYILNLAVADFGVLLFLSLNYISLLIITEVEIYIFLISLLVVSFMHNTSQLLMTAISIDRCVSVLFPFWHRCHRPPHLSTIVCALMWILSFLSTGSLIILNNFGYLWIYWVYFSPSIGVAALCLPLVTLSTMILLFKVFCKSQQPRRGRLLTIILLTLLFFLIFAFPLNAILIINCFTYMEYFDLVFYGFFCACLNSCVNPVIYFLVGKKRGQQRQNLKVILQRAFEEKEEHREEGGTTSQTSV
ncbi:mas-related G-protein coupled receptor member H-like [Heteronotia binoei]|uniref:mas-related G-protein coupled receptor member H-like n=1 Tax=Heteronotia binoei TaxID=13085 RepID=UPI00292F9307|nr:mas-related G-protein coupled receptor member H-like [Heteronotia binoei]